MNPRGPVIVRRDTRAWQMQVWISFAVAVTLCGIGLAWLPGDELDRAFMVMGYVFCMSAAFALAKFVRDNAVGTAEWWGPAGQGALSVHMGARLRFGPGAAGSPR